MIAGIHNQSPLLNMQNTIIIKNSSVFGLIYDSLPSLVSFPERQLLVKPNQAYSISFDIFQKSNKALILAMPRLGFNSNFPTKIPDIFFIGLPLLGHENGWLQLTLPSRLGRNSTVGRLKSKYLEIVFWT